MDVAEPGTVLPGSGHPPRSGALLGGSLDHLQAAALVVDSDDVVAAANGPARTLLRRSAEELTGQDAHDLLHRDSLGHRLPRTRCPLRETLRTGGTGHGGQEWFARGDGTLVQLSWLVAPYALPPGGAGALVLLYEQEQGKPDEDAGGSPTTLSELDRLALLADTTTQLTSTLDVEEALHRLAALTVPRLADWAVVDLLTERDEVRRALVVHHEDGVLVAREDLQGPMPPVLEESPMPLSRALRGAASSLAGSSTYQGPPDSGIAVEQRRLFAETGMHSAAIAPIRGLREVLGALTLGRSAPSRADFSTADLPLLEDLTRRTGLALDNARLYQRQRKVAETMQRHLLPQLPSVPGLQMAARYLPAPDASSVGGDWYDAFPLADGALALAIGDVVGHDLDAAAGMAQLRNMLRAFAWSRPESPGAIVSRLDDAVLHIAEVPMATMVLARLTRDGNGLWRLHWTNAGHPPPLLVTHDGQAQYLTDAHGMLLGTGLARPRPDAAVAVLPPRATLLLYTDGLVESPHHPIDEGLNRLRQHAASLARRPLDSFSDSLLERVRPTDNDDDVAVLALRTPEP
ncbi:SpoIIE family protein phosphatase [Streptomyces sp. NPDC059740]|uniref:SpoIIE family protein phosphatase n=1 Tax=Streptomyces sp. NPDC059740 TaxID=3346926 RepID=UPI003651A7FF